MKTWWVLCEFGRCYQNLFHSCGRWVNFFRSGWNCQFHPFPEIDNFTHSMTKKVTMKNSPTQFYCFTHCVQSDPVFNHHSWRIHPFQNGLFSSPTLLQTQSFSALTHSIVVRLFYLGHHNVHTTIPHTNQTPLWHVWMGFVIYYYPCTNTHIRIKHPPHCPRWIVSWSAFSVFAYTSFAPMVSFYTRNQFSPFCGRTKMRDIYKQKKKRHLPPIFTHHFDRHAFLYRTNTQSNSSVWFHQSILTHAFSPTSFTHLFSHRFFHPPFFTLSFFTLTDSFHPLCHRDQSSPTILCALVSHSCRFHLLVDFTHLQISPTCRFHLFADFMYFHISSTCAWWAGVYPRFYYFIRNSLVVVLLEPLFARVFKLALSVFAYTSFWPTVSSYPLCHRNLFSRKIPCALRFHPLQIAPTLLLAGPSSFEEPVLLTWWTSQIQKTNRGKWAGDGGAMNFKSQPRRPTATLDEYAKLSLTRGRESGKGGGGVVRIPGIGLGAREYIRDISKSLLEWWWGVEEAVHMPACVTYVTKEHFIFSFIPNSFFRGEYPT